MRAVRGKDTGMRLDHRHVHAVRYLEADGPVRKADNPKQFNGPMRDMVSRVAVNGFGGWGLRNTDEMRVLFRACGGTNHPDRFLQGMKTEGFNMHQERRPRDWSPVDMHLWSNTFWWRRQRNEWKGGGFRQIYDREILNEGGDSALAKSDWQGMCIFGRSLSPGEADRYWYRD